MVSIIIINYNTFRLTSECIRSVYKFTTEVEFEVILVDNGSSECNAELFRQEFQKIILVKSRDNLGFAKGNNLGIGYAKGDIILLLNSDTLLMENSIQKCAAKLSALPANTVAITCKLAHPDGRIQQQCSRFPDIRNEFLELTRIHKVLPVQKRAEMFLGSYFNHLNDIYPDWIWGTFFMFSRSIIDEMPDRKLNDDYFMYCEDMRWCYDIRMAKKKIYYYSGTQITHLLKGSAETGVSNSGIIISNELDFVAKSRGKAYMFLYGTARALNLLFASARSGMNYANFRKYLKSAFGLLVKSDN